MKKLTITMSDRKYRDSEWYLQQYFKSKAKLPRLAEAALSQAVATAALCEAGQMGCQWTLADEFESSVYDTSCNNKHEFIEGDAKDNGYEFCPYCGRRLMEKEADAR